MLRAGCGAGEFSAGVDKLAEAKADGADHQSDDRVEDQDKRELALHWQAAEKSHVGLLPLEADVPSNLQQLWAEVEAGRSHRV